MNICAFVSVLIKVWNKFANFNDYRYECYVPYNKDTERRSTDYNDDVVPVFLNPKELSSIQACIPDGHLHTVTYTRCRIDTINSPDDGHMAVRNM